MLPFYDTWRNRAATVQSAAIPYRRDAAGNLEVLLVTSRRKARWVLPKGNVRAMLPHSSAAREAFEEAGVLGVISDVAIGTYPLGSNASVSLELVKVHAFPLAVNTVLQIWPEMDMRERRWHSSSEAIKVIKDGALRSLMKHFFKTFCEGETNSRSE